MKQTLAILFLLLLPVLGFAQYSKGYYHWKYEGDKSITEYTIPDTVRGIGESAFSDCKNLKSVVIGNGVEVIEPYAFKECSNLESAIIHGCVNEIRSSAFSSCQNLKSIVIENGVVEIGYDAFKDCANLESINIPGSVKEIGLSAFSGCKNLKSAVIGNGVIEIGSSAFKDCANLESITIPGSVKGKIDDNCFYGCKKLKSVVIGNGVEEIGSSVFEDCANLESVNIPCSVKKIGSFAFFGCKNLKSIVIENGVVEIGYDAFKDCANLESINIPGSVKKIGSFAFWGCKNLKSVVIGNGVEKIDSYVFKDCANLESVTIPSGIKIFGDAFDGCKKLLLYNADMTELIHVPQGYKDFTFPKSIVRINGHAFIDCTDLESITIPGSVKEIGLSAFAGCKNLKSVVIENGVEEIGGFAFDKCVNLESVNIPGSVKMIGHHAFDGWKNLLLYNADTTELLHVPQIYKEFIISKSIIRISDNAFSDCTELESITIPGSTKEIGNYAFCGCTNLKSVIIENGVEEIGKWAFSDCPNLESIAIPGSVKIINANLFDSSLKYVTIGNGVEYIGKEAFYFETNLESVTIPGSVKKIGKKAFANCSNLKSVVIEDGVEEIDTAAFVECKNLSSITIPSNVKFGVDAFPYLENLSLIISNGTDTISKIWLAHLKSIYIPASVKYIANDAFEYCGIESIIVDSANTNYSIIDGALYNADKTVLIRVPNTCKEFTIPKSVKTISDYAFNRCRIESIIIPKNVKTIGAHAFEKNGSLSNVSIKNGVEKFGAYAFGGCHNLSEVTIPGSCKEIGNNAFWMSYIDRVSFKNGLKTIGVEAFAETCISSLTFPKTLIEIGDRAFNFAGNSDIQSITIPGNVKIIGEGAFWGLPCLTKVTIKDGVEKIGKYAFFKCDSLYSVVLPKSIKEIGHNAFPNISSISCPDDTSSRMHLLLLRCMLEVNQRVERNDSVQYYVDKITDILKTQRDDGNDYSRIYFDFVDYYQKICDFAKMKHYCKEGLKIFARHNNDTVLMSDYLSRLADACIYLREYSEADSALRQIEQLNGLDRNSMLKIYDRSLRARYYYQYLLLKMYYESNDTAKLQEFNRVNSSKSLVRTLDDDLDEYLLKINVLLDNMNLSDLERFVRDVYAGTKRSHSLNSTLGDCYYHYNKFKDAFRYYSMAFNRDSIALRENFSYMNIYQRQLFWQEHKNRFENIVKISTKLPYQKEALILAYNSLLLSKGLLLASEENLSNTINNSKDENLIRDYYKLKNYRTQIDTLKDPSYRNRLVELAGRLETDLMQRSSQFADVVNYMNVDWQKVRNSLEENDVAIEFFYDNDDSLYALVLKKDFESPKLVPLGEFDYKSPFNGVRNVVEGNSYSTLDIYNAVWKPLEKYFSEKGKVYFSPSGKLYNIAIEYAPIDEKRLISEKYKLYRISSTRYLALNAQKTSGKKSAAVFGGIEYNFGKGDWEDLKKQQSETDRAGSFRDVPIINADSSRAGVIYLPGTKIEAENVANSLRAAQYDVNEEVGVVATEGSFKNLSGSGLKIIHIGTHGFYEPSAAADDNGMTKEDRSLSQSGLLFAGANSALDPKKRKDIPEGVDDGILTAKEISRLDFKNLDLVVLSACQTGLGEVTGEGVFGLQRGFKKAGAQTIIMSLWNVDDYATRLLMTEFYKNLVSGKSKREAFLAAQAYVRHKNSDPKYWAAFIMVDAM